MEKICHRNSLRNFASNFPNVRQAKTKLSPQVRSAEPPRDQDMGSILKLRISFPFGENSAGFCKSVGSILNFRIGSYRHRPPHSLIFDTPGRISGHFLDTPGHFLDTPETGARRVDPKDTPCDTPSDTHVFGDTLGGTPRDTRIRKA